MNQRQRSVVHGAGLFAGIEPEQIDAMLGCLNAPHRRYPAVGEQENVDVERSETPGSREIQSSR